MLSVQLVDPLDAVFTFDDPIVIGKTVLVGITFVDSSGAVTETGQWWGTVLAFNVQRGLVVDLSNSGQHHAFPPFVEALTKAEPGSYTLRSTGEVIENPDLLYKIARRAAS